MAKKEKLSKEEKKALKAEKKANQTPEQIETKNTIIKSATAVICAAALCISATSAVGTYCEASKKAAELNAAAAASYQQAGSSSSGSSGSGDVVTPAGDDTTTPEDNTTPAEGEETTAAAEGTTDAGSKTPAKTISLTSGLNSTNVNEVFQYYKLVANHNKKKPGQYITKMTLESLDGGSGGVGKLISAIEPIGKKALAKNSTAGDNIPGTLDKIQVSDWQDAKAVNDGKYTTITINLVPQTDGANGKSNQGTVGRSIGVLDGVQTALDEMGGAVSADFANGKFALKYDHAYIKVKVENSTGNLVKGSCVWHHQVNVIMDELTAKVTVISATIKGGKAVIDYSVTY